MFSNIKVQYSGMSPFNRILEKDKRERKERALYLHEVRNYCK